MARAADRTPGDSGRDRQQSRHLAALNSDIPSPAASVAVAAVHCSELSERRNVAAAGVVVASLDAAVHDRPTPVQSGRPDVVSMTLSELHCVLDENGASIPSVLVQSRASGDAARTAAEAAVQLQGQQTVYSDRAVAAPNVRPPSPR